MAVNSLLQLVYDHPLGANKQENVLKSIGYDVADSFQKKVNTRIKKANLLDDRKKVKITFKYHEAWALELIIRSLVNTSTYYHCVTATYVADMLNQKLA
jgi:hypothetical protein